MKPPSRISERGFSLYYFFSTKILTIAHRRAAMGYTIQPGCHKSHIKPRRKYAMVATSMIAPLIFPASVSCSFRCLKITFAFSVSVTSIVRITFPPPNPA